MKDKKKLSESFNELLSVSGKIVAIKLFEDEESFEEIKKQVSKPEKKLALCQLISKTRYIGSSYIVDPQEYEMFCWASSLVCGFEKIEEDVSKKYSGWHSRNRQAAKESIETLPTLPIDKYNGIYLSPLSWSLTDPDILIFFLNAAQMNAILMAYLHDKGGKIGSEFRGLGACADLIVPVIERRKEINFAIPCNGFRLLALPSDTDLLCSINYEISERLINNLKYMRERGASRYPPAWQHVGWEPQPPISEVLKKGGSPFWLEEK